MTFQKPDLDNTNAGTLYEDYGKRPNRCFPYFIVALICGAVYILWKTATPPIPGGVAYLQQMLFCVAMVRRLSSNCIREVPQSANCSCVSRLASQFAKAVMDAVSSQAFVVSPSAQYYAVIYSIGNAANNTHRVYT